ncbi:hypothetical protein [Vallitalea sp.]|uniref:hypothetical protein n=1 Tax=Vallitalea sp. TaxID=1882829 RepID=UPI0025CF1CF4|nr:hypothetical protein [Vallitalea sp.]MCT4688903.1 hypothetical protein [Vallitalea sp.]
MKKDGYSITIIVLLVFILCVNLMFILQHKDEKDIQPSNVQIVEDTNESILLTEEEMAERLNIPLEKFTQIATLQEVEKNRNGVVRSSEFAVLPMVKVEDKRYYMLDSVIKWLDYNSTTGDFKLLD